MRSQITLGRIRGIRIGLHYSWFVIALLLVFSVYMAFHRALPQWSPLAVGAWAALTTFLFFVSLLMHELSHSLLARRYGLRVREITLFALGGVSQIEGEVPTAGSEFRIAIAGPLTSAVLGIFFLAMIHVPGLATVKPLTAMLLWLGYINLILAAFNLLPGYPMDGGRVLRAFLWYRSGNFESATRTAAMLGNFIAFAFIATGIVDYFLGGGLGGLWIAFLGWFLLQASREAQLDVLLRQELRGIRVSNLMISAPATVDGRMTVQDFVEQELLRSGRRCFVVEDGGRAAGIITPHELRRVDRAGWSVTAVREIMRPLNECESVEPETPLLEALAAMTRQDVNQLPVVVGNHLAGLISRAEVLAFLQTRAEVNMLRTGNRGLAASRDKKAMTKPGTFSGSGPTIQGPHEPRFRHPG